MRRQWLIISVLFFLTACDHSSEEKKSTGSTPLTSQVKTTEVPAVPTGTTQNTFQSFYVFEDKASRQNHYVPSGFMPNGRCLNLQDSWGESCYSGKTCIKIAYDIDCSRKDQRWAGIFWLNPANNWGQRKGGFNLTGAQRLTFWARGEKGGEQVQEFTIGGIAGDYPDTDTAVIGPVILSSEWKQYTIDLRGKDLTYVSGGFAWSTSEEVNPDFQTLIFYLDEIKFE